MSTYHYKAKKGPGQTLTGLLEAESRSDALDKLSQQGVYPLSVQEFQDPASVGRGILRPVSRQQLAFFTRQLADLLESNVALLRALEITHRQTRQPALGRIIESVQEQIAGGKSFSDALRMYPRVFSPLYVNLIYAGEVGEMLPLTLSRLAEFLEQEDEFRSRLLAALAYPAFILIIGALTILFLMLFVVPRLAEMFIDSGEGLPWIARVLTATSGFLTSAWGMAILAVVIGGLATLVIRLPRQAKAWIDQTLIRLPLWGPVIRKGMLARFTRTLAMLLSGGVPILQALKVVAHVLDHPLYHAQVTLIASQVEQGDSFAESVQRTALFPDFVCQMIAVGEESNQLEKSLEKIAVTYTRETDRAMKLATSMLEPVMILGVGSIIGVIVIGMLLPIFQISTFVK